MDFCCYNSFKISTKSFRTHYTFCTECVDSAILLLLTVINTNITMVISKNQLSLRDTQKHCIAISGHDLVTSLHVKKSKYCFIVTFSRLPLSNQAYDVLKS